MLKPNRFIITAAFSFAIMLILAALPGSLAQQITDVSYSGQCGDFIVTVTAEGLYDNLGEQEGMGIQEGQEDYEECWDVKLDVPGRVFDGSIGESGEWRSSFYYVNDAVCYPELEASIKLKPGSIEPVVEGTARLRQDDKIIEKAFIIHQDCPQPLGWEWALLGAVAVIVFFIYLLAWWIHHK